MTNFPDAAEALARESGVTLEEMFGPLGPDLFVDLPGAVRALTEAMERSFETMLDPKVGAASGGGADVVLPVRQLWALALYASESAKNAALAQDRLDATAGAVKAIMAEMGVLDEFNATANRIVGRAMLHMATGGDDE